MSLLKERRFLPYFLTQFLGAFNDNVFKNALVIILTYKIVSSQSSILVNLAAVIFILPYFLFSPLSGQLADKYEKSALIRRIKWMEVCIMVLGVVGLWLNSIPALMSVLFLMGTQSSFFGPIKYSILPQHLQRSELMSGNALVEAGTFLAILFGTIVGGLLAGLDQYILPVSIAILTFSVLGLIACHFIPPANAEKPDLKIDRNPYTSGKKIFSTLASDQSNFYTAFGISWFWFYGATFLTQIPNFSREYLQGTPYVATLMMAMFSIGIGLGSIASSRISRGRVELGLVPLGALGMSICGAWLGLMDLPFSNTSTTVIDMLSHWSTTKSLVALALLALSGGIYIVPMYAHIQTNTPAEYLSRNIAANNMLNALLMVIAGVFAIVSFALGNSIQSLFVIVAILNAIVALFIFRRVPEFTFQLIAWLLMHSLYRIGKHELHHIPREGPAILACNHVSFVDSVVIGAVCPRPMRFVMYHKLYETPIVKRFFKNAGAIPIAPHKENPQLLQQAYDTIAEALDSGELVCIFPEGGLTPDGELQEFRPGIERMLKRTPVPVVPMALSGLWGTWFSRKNGQAMKGWPRSWMKKIDLHTGEPIAPENATLSVLSQRIQALKQRP